VPIPEEGTALEDTDVKGDGCGGRRGMRPNPPDGHGNEPRGRLLRERKRNWADPSSFGSTAAVEREKTVNKGREGGP